MVNVSIKDGLVIFELKGWSKIWAFKQRLVVPLSSIRVVRRAPPDIADGWWKGWRIPGTHLPGVIIAGTYYENGARKFWDVRRRAAHAIVVDLADARYQQLIVDVENPDSVIRQLQEAASFTAQ